jgi:predicted DNA-binding transcriptional regulator YafY
MPRGDQLARQWRLIQLIDRPQGITVEDAARELACTVRTIWRDLGVLQQAGFPVYTERAADGNATS